MKKYVSPPLERVCGEENMRQHARPGQLVQQVREVEQLQVQRRQLGPGQEYCYSYYYWQLIIFKPLG